LTIETFSGIGISSTIETFSSIFIFLTIECFSTIGNFQLLKEIFQLFEVFQDVGMLFDIGFVIGFVICLLAKLTPFFLFFPPYILNTIMRLFLMTLVLHDQLNN
jgi:hypothetical protein